MEHSLQHQIISNYWGYLLVLNFKCVLWERSLGRLFIPLRVTIGVNNRVLTLVNITHFPMNVFPNKLLIEVFGFRLLKTF